MLPIHHTFGPHVTLSYALQTLAMLCTPWRWRSGRAQESLRAALQEKFGGSAHLFAAGRESLLALFRSLNAPSGSEIIVQGYTCAALPNAIHAAGFTPVYADIDPETLNLTSDTIAAVISDRTCAVIVQHTFGNPADTEAILALCTEHNLTLIEDCAHVLPDSADAGIGAHGDVLMLSFGRDKAISGITGGAIITRDKRLSPALTGEERTALPLPHTVIARLLLYPLLYFLLRPVYSLGIGKALLWISGKLTLLQPVLTREEKQGYQSPNVHTLPNACAHLALWELRKLKSINEHRRALAEFYKDRVTQKLVHDAEKHPLQKYPLLHADADRIRTALKKQNIHLEDGWTGAVICPRSVDQLAENYQEGSCPNAERVAREIVTLPTHPTMSQRQAKKLVRAMEQLTRG